MQIYADILGREIKISRSAQTCALGSAIMASVAAGAHSSVLNAIKAMTGYKPVSYTPHQSNAQTYNRINALYTMIHDAFGISGNQSDLSLVMKELLTIKKEATS
jgi:L-ribulokinase